MTRGICEDDWIKTIPFDQQEIVDIGTIQWNRLEYIRMVIHLRSWIIRNTTEATEVRSKWKGKKNPTWFCNFCRSEGICIFRCRIRHAFCKDSLSLYFHPCWNTRRYNCKFPWQYLPETFLFQSDEISLKSEEVDNTEHSFHDGIISIHKRKFPAKVYSPLIG